MGVNLESEELIPQLNLTVQCCKELGMIWGDSVPKTLLKLAVLYQNLGQVSSVLSVPVGYEQARRARVEVMEARKTGFLEEVDFDSVFSPDILREFIRARNEFAKAQQDSNVNELYDLEEHNLNDLLDNAGSGPDRATKIHGIAGLKAFTKALWALTDMVNGVDGLQGVGNASSRLAKAYTVTKVAKTIEANQIPERVMTHKRLDPWKV